MKKTGARMKANCWYCQYDGEFETCLTPVNKTIVYDKAPSKPGQRIPTSTQTHVTHLDDDALSGTTENLQVDLGTDDEKPDDLSFWFDDIEDWALKSNDQNPDAKNFERVRMPPQEISVLEGLLSGIVDESKYYFTVNSLTSIVTVRWKHSERGSLWERFVKTKQTVDGIGFKKFHSSASSSLSIRAYAECIIRDKRWCTWHSRWMYDTRPLAMPTTDRNFTRYELLVSHVTGDVLLHRTFLF